MLTGENKFGVDRILSKCWNCYLAFNLSESVTPTPLISDTLGNLYTINVLTKTVLETSLFSILRLVNEVSTSNFEICMKLCMLLSEKMSFLSF